VLGLSYLASHLMKSDIVNASSDKPLITWFQLSLESAPVHQQFFWGDILVESDVEWIGKKVLIVPLLLFQVPPAVVWTRSESCNTSLLPFFVEAI